VIPVTAKSQISSDDFLTVASGRAQQPGTMAPATGDHLRLLGFRVFEASPTFPNPFLRANRDMFVRAGRFTASPEA
jgi:hypothetical protein